MRPLNTILYGPPGTGKTYQTTALAVQHLEALTDAEQRKRYPTRAALRRRAEQHRQAGRLATVIFHPSFAYEDFVEGIKPYSNERGELRYAVEDGVFKQLCVRAAHALYRTQQQNALDARPTARRNFDALYFEFVDYLRRTATDNASEIVFESKTSKPFYLVDINQNDTLSLHRGPGRKTYAVTRGMLKQLYRKFDAAEDIRHLQRDLPTAVRSVGSVAWAVFRRLKEYETTRNDTYRSLLAGHDAADAAQYQAMKRDIRSLDYAHLSAQDYASADRFVLIVDEINRGNVAAIFGELIALLEDDKRAGRPEALTTVLPYSRESFSVPPNLYLIGTMNTADRSVETLDTALRRRFSFISVPPDPSQLGPVNIKIGPDEPADEGANELDRAAEPSPQYGNQPEYEIDLAALLRVMNQRLMALTDTDHQLGHAYLMRVTTADDALAALREVFYRSIIPLLQEYFFSETERVMLVIGSSFFETTSENSAGGAGPDQTARWPDEPTGDPQYHLRTLTDGEFIRALQEIYREE